MKNPLRHPKRRGEWVELQFMARAAAHGFTVSKPWGDSARYDFVVDSGGVFRRVQVKSTSYRDGRAFVCNATSRGPTGRGYAYSPKEIDFFAFFIIPADIWYIVPAADMRSAVFAARLDPFNGKNKYCRYLEAWHLLQE